MTQAQNTEYNIDSSWETIRHNIHWAAQEAIGKRRARPNTRPLVTVEVKETIKKTEPMITT